MNQAALRKPDDGRGPAAPGNLREARGRKSAILDQATRLFLEEGYAAATTNALVARVGGSKSTIYSHFASKEKLFASVVDHVLAQLKAATGDFNPPRGDVRRLLVELGKRLLSIALSPDHIALARMVIGEAHRFPEIGAIYYEHGPALAQEGVVAFLLAHDVMPGASRKEVREAAEWFTGRLIHSAFIRALCGPGVGTDVQEPEQVANETARNFLQHFTGPAGDSVA